MVDLTSDVTVLPGCGTVTKRKLAQLGIYNVGDLLQCTSSNALVSKFKTIAQSNIPPEPPKQEYAHSWLGYVGYIYRSSGKVTRVMVGKCTVLSSRVVVQVTWHERKEPKSKGVNIFQLLHNQFNWLNNDIVSEDSDSESPYFICSLPLFQITERAVPTPLKNQLDQLTWEVQNLQLFMAGDLSRPRFRPPCLDVLACIQDHSWLGYSVYVIRAKGRVTRGVIDSLVFTDSRVSLYVYWRTTTKVWRTTVDPVSLLYQQKMWKNNDIVSDSDDGEDGAATFSPRESILDLPQFTVEPNRTSHLHSDQLNALKLTQKELNHLQNFI